MISAFDGFVYIQGGMIIAHVPALGGIVDLHMSSLQNAFKPPKIPNCTNPIKKSK